MIYNAGNVMQIDKLCSQIDLLPTLFSYLNWQYVSQFYGKNILEISSKEERALVENYRILGLMQKGKFTQFNDKYQAIYENVSDMKELPQDGNKQSKNITILYYQATDEIFSNGKMRINYFEKSN